jgi:hypothetical protein
MSSKHTNRLNASSSDILDALLKEHKNTPTESNLTKEKIGKKMKINELII